MNAATFVGSAVCTHVEEGQLPCDLGNPGDFVHPECVIAALRDALAGPEGAQIAEALGLTRIDPEYLDQGFPLDPPAVGWIRPHCYILPDEPEFMDALCYECDEEAEHWAHKPLYALPRPSESEGEDGR